MNIFKRITTSLSIAIFAICCGAFVLFTVSGTGWKALSVPTGSMRPHISPGSLVLVRRVPNASLKVGDVITYINPANIRQTISHRIIKTYLIGGKIPGFVTKGDANPIADRPVAAGSVVGKVAWHIPKVGSWLMWAKKPIGLLAIVYVPALLLMIEEVQRLSEYLRLAQPYKLREREYRPQVSRKKYVAGMGLTVLSILAAVALAQPALAALKSNTVVLANNRLGMATNNGGQCSGNNHTSININNNSSQTASSGNASSSGNTSGGSAASGNATNNNFTNITTSITSC